MHRVAIFTVIRDIPTHLVNNSRGQITTSESYICAITHYASRARSSMHSLSHYQVRATAPPVAVHSHRSIRRVSRAITFVSLPFHSAAISCFIADGSRRRRVQSALTDDEFFDWRDCIHTLSSTSFHKRGKKLCNKTQKKRIFIRKILKKILIIYVEAILLKFFI